MRPLRLSPALLLAAVLVVAALPGTASADGLPARAREAYRAYLAGDLDRADAVSAQAVKESARSGGAWAVRGYVLSKRGDKGGAAVAYRRAVLFDPTSAIAHNNLGAVLLELGDVPEAIQAFEAALKHRPIYADARNNLGAAYERQGKLAEAQRSYRTATMIDPEHAQAFNNLGAVQLKSGDVQAASASFARAAEIDPDFGVPALNLALLGNPEDRDEAFYRKMMAEAAKPGASPRLRARVLAMRAARETDKRDWRAARALYVEALNLTPRDVTLLNNIAVVEDQLGMDREALLHLTEALDVNPDLLVAQNNVGIVHVHRGDMDLARAVFEDIIRRDNDFHRAHYNLGVVNASEGKVQAARQNFRTAARLAPRDASIRYNLAILNRRDDGDVREELRAYREVLSLDPKLTEAHLALGMLLADPGTPRNLRDAVEAARHLERFLALAPASDEEGRTQATEWLAWLRANG